MIQEELKTSHLVTFPPGCIVVLVFDTDNELTSHLKKNIELLKKRCSGVKVLTVPQVLNFEDEIIRCTDINKAPELTKSPSISEFKTAVNKIKETEFRKLLDRHNFDLNKIWIKTPPDIFSFVSQDSGELKNG